MPKNIQGAMLALVAFAVFATHDVFLKVLGASYSPFQILFFAVLFGFPLSLVMLLFDKTEANLRPRHPWWTLLRTIATMIGAVSGVYAFSTLPLSQVYAILFAIPLLVTLLAVPILGERIRLRRALAVLVGLVGVIVVLQPGTTELGLGHLAALTAAFASSLASVIIRKIGQDERSIVLLVLPQLANFVFTGSVLYFVYEPMPIEDIGSVAMVAILGVIAMSLIIAAYNKAEAVIVAPMQYSQILWATFFGYMFFNEGIDQNTILGASIIIASGCYIVWRESGGAGEEQPVLGSSDQRPSLAIRPRVGDIFRVLGGRSEKK